MDSTTNLQERKPLTRSQIKNREAMEALVKGIAVIIVIGVTAFAEVAFLGMVSKMFPSNPIFQGGAILGAVATGLSVDTLLFAKLKWIRAGHQHWISWVFFGAEVTIMILNLTISFKLANGIAPERLDSWLYTYYQWMPATPLVALVGWTAIFMTDRSKEMDDARRDMSDELEEAELGHKREQHQVMMQLRRDITHIHANQVRAEVEKRIPEIERITAEIVADEIGSMIGMYIPRQVGGRVVESTAAPASLAQTGTTALPPAGEKEEVKTAKKPRPFHSDQSTTGTSTASGAKKQLPPYNAAAAARRQHRTARRQHKA